jgi:hypothetical protein
MGHIKARAWRRVWKFPNETVVGVVVKHGGILVFFPILRITDRPLGAGGFQSMRRLARVVREKVERTGMIPTLAEVRILYECCRRSFFP